ncbi:MAG: hypothetical protein U0R24_07390 [Solirubrobacterales bacterium]
MIRAASTAIGCLLALLALALAAPALAACPDDVPDNSEIDQYLESIPSACGEQQPGTTGGGGSEDGSAPAVGDSGPGGSVGAGSGIASDLSPAVRAELSRRGADGAAVAGLVPMAGLDGARQRDPAPGVDADDGSLIAALVSGVSGSDGGLGPAGILIAAGALLGLGFAGWRLIRR